MPVIKIRKGLNLPVTGTPERDVTERKTKTVALCGPDYNGMKPSMKVQEGDHVKTGQPLFECKKNPGLVFTAPASGKVLGVNRGERRAFQTVVIERDENESFHSFSSYKNSDYKSQSVEEIKALLNESGMWSAIRTRPYSKSAPLEGTPNSIFITAMDSNPLSFDPQLFIQEHQVAFNDGVNILDRLSEGKTFVCRRQGSRFDVPSSETIEVREFSGVHPSGNVGTHIHFLDPVGPKKTVWHVGYQDVVAMGKLFGSGKFFSERWVSLCGPQARRPRIIKTILGADLIDLCDSEQKEGENRIVSGSALAGRRVDPEVFHYLGRFHNQVTLLREERKREFMGWHDPGFNRFSVMRTFVSKLMPGKKFNLGTSRHGSFRAIVPVGAYEKIMPLDILPTQLLKSLLARDTDTAQALGCLELDEEDLALCTFVDPGKEDFGPILRENLTIIEKEG